MITVSMKRGDLAAALAAAFVAVGPDDKGDLTSHFTFRVGSSGIEVLTYNRICHARVPISGTVEGDGAGCFSLEAKRLRGCLQAAPGDEIRIQANNNSSELRVGTWSASIRGLPTARFPFWDKELAEAKVLSRIKVGRFVPALGYVAKFAEQEDTRQPALCAVYVVDGRMQATDCRCAAYVDIPELQGSNFRVFIDAVPRLLNFFKDADPAGEVEILEGGRYLYARRQDGAVFACQMLQTADPTLQSKMRASEPGMTRITIKKEDLSRSLSFLDSITSDAEFRVGMRTGSGLLRISMRGEATSQDECVDIDATYSSPCEVQFSLHRATLKTFLVNWKGDDVCMDVVGVGPSKNGSSTSGYSRFEDARDGLVFWSVLQWIKR